MNTATTAELTAQFDDLAEKVDRLALRYAELKRTNALLQERVRQVEAERDSLRTRLTEARNRVDHLLARLGPADGQPPLD